MLEKTKLCQYFQEGYCRFGNNCRFIHAAYQPRPCEYFIKGRCKLINDCPNIHDGVKYDLKCFAVRHGESEFNLRLQSFAQKNNNNIHCQEAKEFQFDESLIDAPLTDLGREQSLLSHKKYQNYDIELVFVSPMNRALQTCDIIFKGKKLQVIVIPEFAEILSMVCDVSRPIAQKVAKYKQFDFSQFKKLDNNWQVPCVSVQHQIPFEKITSPQESMDQIFGLMKQHFPNRLQSDQDCRKRVIKGTARMKRICQKRNIKNVAVVAHRRVIRELSKNYYEKYGVGLENAEIIEINL